MSGKTVARHLANVFIKLNLSSRTAAAVYAFEHGLTEASSGEKYPRATRRDA